LILESNVKMTPDEYHRLFKYHDLEYITKKYKEMGITSDVIHDAVHYCCPISNKRIDLRVRVIIASGRMAPEVTPEMLASFLEYILIDRMILQSYYECPIIIDTIRILAGSGYILEFKNHVFYIKPPVIGWRGIEINFDLFVFLLDVAGNDDYRYSNQFDVIVEDHGNPRLKLEIEKYQAYSLSQIKS